jgi:predicted membrane protein
VLAREDSRRLRRFFKWTAILIATPIALVLILAAIFAGVFHVHLGNGVGEKTYVVDSKQELRRDYKLGVGHLKVDLRGVSFPVGEETQVDTRVDVGNLEVIVPDDVALRVHADAQAGDVDVLGRTDDGRNADVTVDEAGARVLVLDAHVGAGKVHVTRAVR